MALEYSIRVVIRKDRIPDGTGYSAYSQNTHSEMHPISDKAIGLAYVPKGMSLQTIRGFKDFLQKLEDIGGDFKPIREHLREEEGLVYDRVIGDEG